MTHPPQAPSEQTSTGGMGRVAVLALGVFAVGTGEFVLAGLLPMLVEAFEISVAGAGQIVTVFALTCAVSAPVLTALTAVWRRRTVLVMATVIYLLGAVGTALAGSYGQILAAQIVAAAGVGLFIPNASVTAATLVAPRLQGRAIALVVTGFTAAVAFGAPIGTALGGLLDWRATMWFTAALAVIGLVGVWVLVPEHLHVPSAGGLRAQLRPLGDRRVLLLLVTTLVAFTAVFVPYTYIGVIYAPATGGSGVALAVLMLTGGIAGAVGNLAAGFLTDRLGGARVVTIALSWLTAGLLVVPLAVGHFGAALAVVGFYVVGAFAITTPQQHRLIGLRPDATPIVISLNQSVLYLAIAMSGLVGGAGIELLGSRYVSLVAAALALLALGASLCAQRLMRPTSASGAGV
ncbi:DHA1 family inner membrane transport protein [Actinoalloteichus hoggarensis]|uniref:MFS transporter n=1 Tax=Actinoalloteichus hoggarensis TaxID=1470176 RepID=UPI00180C5D30|nr:MFS transporter [Actinoalloteichus hoggarensis]MBB5922688.1 DHA1 family inner membrane transport protein [Actinoalloteichus hoggarensis]